MEERKRANISIVRWLVPFLIVAILGSYLFVTFKPHHYGIGLQFASDASIEYRQSLIEDCNADDVIQDKSDPNYYKLVFQNKSEQDVIKLANKLFDEEYVIDANCIQIDN